MKNFVKILTFIAKKMGAIVDQRGTIIKCNKRSRLAEMTKGRKVIQNFLGFGFGFGWAGKREL